MEEGHLLDAGYTITGGEPVIRLLLRTDDGPVLGLVRGFRPYLYALPEDDDRDALRDRIEDATFTTEDGEDIPVLDVEDDSMVDGTEERPVLRVHTDVPPNIPKLKERLWELDVVDELREFDIPFYKRYLIDTGLRPPGRASFEAEPVEDDRPIETVEIEEIGQADDGPELLETDPLAFDLEVYQDEIIMCSFYSGGYEKVLTLDADGADREYVEECEDERALLERMLAIVDEQDPDVIVGYNTDEFDFDTLRDRSEHHGIDLDMGRMDRGMRFRRRGRFQGAKLFGRVHLDLYAFVSTVVSMTLDSETLTLDAVAGELLGANKEDMDWEDIKAAWKDRERLDELVEYALRDSELAYRLADTLVPQVFSIAYLVGLTPFDACRTSYGQLVENYMLRSAQDQGILAPNRPTQSDIAQRHQAGAYAGGFVYEPEKGLHEDIALFDFKSLYPTIIVSHNISPDTLDREDCGDELEVETDENEYVFCQDEPGFIPDILESIVSERYEIKQRLPELEEGSPEYHDRYNRQYALKTLSNAFYGYLGYASARWYSRECAEATTFLGRKYIHDTIDIAEERGFEVVYGDTDSVFLKGNDIAEHADEFASEVNDTLPSFMELELEDIFVRGLFTYTDSGEGAKKKYAMLRPDGSVKITGFEQVRRDWSPIAKDTQEEVIGLVLENRVDEAVERVKEVIEELQAGEVELDRLRIYSKMTKKPENYDAKSPHVEAAKRAIERGKDISPGDTIAYVITAGGGTISDRAEILEHASDYDATYYIENQVIPVALRVLKVFGYTEGQLKGEGKQSGLGKFT